MRHLVERTRRILRDTPDTVCLERARLLTEAYQRHEGEPPPLRRALALRHVLRYMTLDLHTNPLFAGNVSSGPRRWMLLPESGFQVPEQAVVEHPQLKGFLDGDVIPAELRAYWATRVTGAGIGHLGVNLYRVVHQGLESILAEIEAHRGADDPEAQTYRGAMAVACQAVMEWAERYAVAAARAARSAVDPAERRALERVAGACAQVPAQPARNLFEALQAVVLVHLALHLEGHGFSVSVGLPDRVLQPFLPEAANPDTVDLLAAFLLKLSENSVWGSFSKTQAVTVGGADARGMDRSNAFTLAFLEASVVANMPDPHLFLRWHENMDPRVKERAVELLAEGRSMPLLIGDRETVAGFVSAGIPPSDAWEYAVFGCNELGIPGKMVESAVGP
ncbi:MAG: pyruvate formate lyase family protein, partial [Armatimonadota bacterium]|nr:pyruvate formate lyase family protein [Armatimonadota bacterium]